MVIRAPEFEPVVIERDLTDGYWIQPVDVDGDGRPDLVTSGLADGVVAWYRNGSWDKHVIARFEKPVSLATADIAGAGRHDLVVCHDYGGCMFDCGPDDGKISWLRNPGTVDGSEWERRSIGSLVATHRLRVGAFTHPAATELLALPVVGPDGGQAAVHAPIRVTLYRPPQNVLEADAWDAEVVDDQTFRIIHGVAVGSWGPSAEEGVASTLLASEEGLTWFGHAGGGWQHMHLGTGEPDPVGEQRFRGSGNVAVGRIGDDPTAYIATVEPFHGRTIAVYAKDQPGIDLVDARWRRIVLDDFGDVNERGEGPAHHVVAADFDGDGDDEFLVALRGPMPFQGVFYYKAVDVMSGLWIKTRVSTPSAARIAVADFDGDGRLDFATTGYYTPGYFLCDDPQNVVFLNRYGAPTEAQPAIPSGPLGG